MEVVYGTSVEACVGSMLNICGGTWRSVEVVCGGST